MNQSSPSRRAFLEQTGLAGVGVLSALRTPIHEAKTMIPIVDTHQHLLNITRYKLNWLAPRSPLDRSYSQADYDAAAAGLGIEKTVYMEVDVDVSQQLEEAEEVAATCAAKKTTMAAAAVSGRPASASFGDYINSIKKHSSIKGVRQVLHSPATGAGFCLEKSFVAGIQLLGEHGLGFDLCMRAEELSDAAKLIDACPQTRFILDHCGNPNVQAADLSGWRRGIDDLAKRPRLVCKVSGLVESAKAGAWSADDLAPLVDHVVDAFGPDRVIFAGNWPVCTLTASLAEWVRALQSIVHERPEVEQKKLFYDNALKLYGLS